MLHDIHEGSYYERGRFDARTRVNAIDFDPLTNQIAIAQERDRLVEVEAEKLNKLFDLFFISISEMAKEGIRSSRIPADRGKLTGKSFLDLLRITPQISDEDAKLWSIYRTSLARGEKEKTYATLAKLASDYPRFAEVRRVMAALSAPVATNKAQALLDEAIKSNPNCSACYRTLGDLQTREGLTAKAIPNYRRALEIKPDYGLVEGLLAAALGATANERINPDDSKAMEEAIGLVFEAIRLRPAEPRRYTNMATAFFLAGELERAIELNLIAQKIRPGRSRVYYNLGRAYQQKGDKEKAVEAYRRYVAMAEKGEEARVERARIQIEALNKIK